MAIWRCFSQHGMTYVESPDNPSNAAMQCVMESGDPGDAVPDDFRPGLRLPPEVVKTVLGTTWQPSLGVAYSPVFRDPVGPTPEDPYTDPTMAEVFNPPSSPKTNLLQGPWNGQLFVSSTGGINPDLSKLNPDDEREAAGSNFFGINRNWLWLLLVAVGLYLWSRKR